MPFIWPAIIVGGLIVTAWTASEAANAADEIADATTKIVIAGAIGLAVVYAAKKGGVIK